MGKELTTNKVGRPTKMNEELVVKLESIFKIGGTIDEACSYALIDRATYYRWLEDNKDFATKMESAQHYADIVAKNVVVDSMIKDKDLDTAKWWLEKRQFRERPQTNMVQVNVLNKLDSQKKDYNLDE